VPYLLGPLEVFLQGNKERHALCCSIGIGERCKESSTDLRDEGIDVFVKGPGPGRETAIRALQAVGLDVKSIKDVTPIPHNGCRPPKARRV